LLRSLSLLTSRLWEVVKVEVEDEDGVRTFGVPDFSKTTTRASEAVVAVAADNEVVAVAVAEAVAVVAVEGASNRIDNQQVSLQQLPHFPIPVTVGPIGARLSQYLPNWLTVTNDKWVLSTVALGHQWEFHTRPPLYRGNM
jgi:hypothetical protein